MWVDVYVYVCGCADLFYWLECTVTLARMNQISVIKEPSITPIIVIFKHYPHYCDFIHDPLITVL